MPAAMVIGCALIAFGPSVMFLFAVVRLRSVLTLLAVLGAFAELLGVLASGVVLVIASAATTDETARAVSTVVVGALLQEVFRFALVLLYGRVEKGLKKATRLESLPFPDFASALAAGLGFGLAYALLVYGNVLVTSGSPADYFTEACPETSFFIVAALCALAMQMLHVALTVLAFDALRRRGSRVAGRFFRVLFVCVLHVAAGLSTVSSISDVLSSPGCYVGVPLLYAFTVLAVFAAWAAVRSENYHAGGTVE